MYFLDTTKPRMWLFSKILSFLLGQEITIQKRGKVIHLSGDVTLHASGTLKLESDKHIILSSGKGKEERPGYRHSVWLNPDLDARGRPIQKLQLVNERGQEWDWEIEFDHRGALKLPEGWGMK